MLSQLPDLVIELLSVSRANRFSNFPTQNSMYFAKDELLPHTISLVKDKLLEFALKLEHKMLGKQ